MKAEGRAQELSGDTLPWRSLEEEATEGIVVEEKRD
jgi:hypothetical protein